MSIINSVIKGKQPVIDTLNVTPTTSAQQITAPSGTDGYSPVNVSAVTSSIDANIVAGNIKKDVQILGVTGSYEGTTPTGTLNIPANGVYDVTNYASADVQVPTTAPAYYIEKSKDANNKLQNGSTIMNFSGIEDFGDYALNNAYANNSTITGTVDLSSVTKITGRNCCSSAFAGCSGITGIDLSNLEYISGQQACSGMFNGCTGLTGTINFSSLKYVSNGIIPTFQGCSNITGMNLSNLQYVYGSSCLSQMCQNCTNLTTVNLGLKFIDGYTACNSMFINCAGLTNIDLSSLRKIRNTNCCQNMFQNCTNLSSVDISKLLHINGNGAMGTMFRSCTSLSSLSFNGLAYTTINFNNAFSSMLQGCSNVTVHFPAEWQTDMASWANVTGGFGGTNTTVLFDLPNVRSVDLSDITIVYGSDLQYLCQNCTQITSIDLSGLVDVNKGRACQQICENCTSLTSVDLSNLETIDGGTEIFLQAFKGCTALTSIDLGKLKTTSLYANTVQEMFSGCTSLSTVNLSALEGINSALRMFYGCTSLTSITFASLNQLLGNDALNYTFQDCTGLTTLSFPALTSTSFPTANMMLTMLSGCSGVTVHFPSNLQSRIGSWTSVTGGFGGTNTTVLFDLPATE